jgi:HK97 family phage portal protein
MPNMFSGLLSKLARPAPAAVEKAAHTFTSADFMAGVPMPKPGGNTSGAYSNSWVTHACIKRMATDCAGVPLLILSDPDDTDSVVSDSHPLARLLRDPSPDFSQSEMIQWWVTWLQLRGEFFAHFDNWLAPKELVFWKDPSYWREQMAMGRVTGWQYQRGADAYTLPRGAVIQHRFINPDNPWRGLAPIVAAAKAYAIETGADTLQEDVMARGGERAVLYRAPADTTLEQREQALAMLRGRRRNDGTVGKDVMLPNGVEVIDPRFIENDLSILDSQAAQPDKICAVFGMSKSLLGIEDVDKYATFQGRRDVYLTNTLLPMLHGIESTLDAYLRRNMTSQWQAFVRFDIAKLEAYAEQLKAKFEMANAAHAAGLPWAVCNERFQLGLPIEDVPGADDVLVPMGSVPLTKLIEEWEADPGDPAPPTDGSTPPPDEPDPVPPAGSDDGAAAPASKGLTQQLVNKRAADPRATLQRQIRITRAEKAMRDDWRKVVGAASKQAQRAVADATNADRVNAAISGATLGLGDKLVAVAEKYHQRAASEGSRSIIELTTGKMNDAEVEVHKARAAWQPEVEAFIKQRQNLVQGMAQELFDDVVSAAVDAVTKGVEGSELVSLVAERFGSAPGGLNRAVTIARTEIGSAYSIARHSEMKAQGFDKHMWTTAEDEKVRREEFDHAECNGQIRNVGDKFSCGLEYPMASGGAPGNVINCRCETIPVVSGME